MRTGIAVAAIAASFALAFVVAAPVLAYQHSGMSSNTTSNMTMAGDKTSTMTSGFIDRNMSMPWFSDTGKMFGLISSLQNGENGERAWMTTGHWMMTNDTGASNITETAGTNITDFYAWFQRSSLSKINLA
jgi:hypothetical protein